MNKTSLTRALILLIAMSWMTLDARADEQGCYESCASKCEEAGGKSGSDGNGCGAACSDLQGWCDAHAPDFARQEVTCGIEEIVFYDTPTVCACEGSWVENPNLPSDFGSLCKK